MSGRSVKECTLASDAGIDPLRAQHLEAGPPLDPRRNRLQRRHRGRGGKPAGVAGATQGPRRPRADRAGAVAGWPAVARRIYARASDAAHHLELERLGRYRPARRFARNLHRDGDRRAPAGAGDARSGGPGVFRAAGRRLLLPRAAGRRRARAKLAVALGQGCAAAGPRSAGPALWPAGRSARQGRAAIRARLADGAEFVVGAGDGT